MMTPFVSPTVRSTLLDLAGRIERLTADNPRLLDQHAQIGSLGANLRGNDLLRLKLIYEKGGKIGHVWPGGSRPRDPIGPAPL
jgi:hypothetical protein